MDHRRIVSLALAASLVIPAAARGETPSQADPLAFFEGRTAGDGRIAAMMGRSRAVTVSSAGRVEPDGTLVVDQIVTEQGKPPRDRAWRIRETAPGRYVGTMTDATSPIAGKLERDRLTLDFRIKGGLAVRQSLTFASDGMSARNVMVVSKWGMKVARLDETIRRLDPPTIAR